jgi:hypothetical protein
VDQSAGQRGSAVDADEQPAHGDQPHRAERFAAGGLENFLAALAGGAERGFGMGETGGRGGAEREIVDVPAEAFGGPEMVSLDDLLDEEERRTGSEDDWGDDTWSYDSDRLN